MKKAVLAFFLIFSAGAVFPQDRASLPEEYKKDFIEIDYSNAQIVDHSVYGVMILSLDRWKNWLIRSSIIAMVFATLVILFISIPKDNELNIMLAYAITGAMFSVAFWETLAGWMLTRLSQNLYGTLIMAASILMYAAFYVSLIKIKKTDLSFSSIKESFQKMSQMAKEDPRLVSVSGLPGDWEKEDFVK